MSSKNLRLGISDYEYSELGNSLMDSVSMIGSYTSLPSMLDIIMLEDEYAEYLMESGDFTLSESIKESFGHFLFQRDSFKSLEEIKEK